MTIPADRRISLRRNQRRLVHAEPIHGALDDLRRLTVERAPTKFVPLLQQVCAGHGIAVVFVPAPPGCPVHGATRWLTPDKALLALSVRYKTDDQLWFSFFHELGHLLKHGKRMLFIEGPDGLDDEREQEANRFAADVLIPPSEVDRLRNLRSAEEVERVAEALQVSSGIVVGRMQHERWLPHSHLNALKVRYEWADTTEDQCAL